MKKLILILTLLISTMAFTQSNPLINGLFANIQGNLFDVNRLSFLSSDNLTMSVLSGRYTLTQTGATIQNFFDGTIVVALAITSAYPQLTLTLGAYSNLLGTSNAEGITGNDFRIGLDETRRTMIIGDAGDIAFDYGLSALSNPTLIIARATAGVAKYMIISYNNMSFYEGINLDLLGNSAQLAFRQRINIVTTGGVFLFQSTSVSRLTDTDGHQVFMKLEPKLNQSGTAGFTAFDIDVSVIDAAGNGEYYLANFKSLGVEKFSVDSSGNVNAYTYNFAADGQGNDDYEISLPGVSPMTDVTQPPTGMMVTFTATTINTDGATLEITEFGDVDALLKGDGNALATGDITAGLPITAFFNGTAWIIMSRLASD